jgi:anthranilate phosphoribosyltransferase
VASVLEECVKSLRDGKKLEEEEAAEAARDLLDRFVSDELKTEFLSLLSKKGVTDSELLGVVSALRNRAFRFAVSESFVDVCGTGGTRKKRLNISTMVAFVLASAGVTVIKHCGRGSHGKTGSLDFLDALRCGSACNELGVRKSIQRFHIGFLSAQHTLHELANVREARRRVSGATVMNLALPLINPALKKPEYPTYHLIGAPNSCTASLLARVLKTLIGRDLPFHRAWVVVGAEGIDELTPRGTSYIWHVTGESISRSCVTPSAFGVRPIPYTLLPGGDAEIGARVFLDIISGRHKGAARDMIALNAGAAFTMTGKTECVREGYLKALSSIRDGSVLRYVRTFRETFH